jgi:hypothetical protein
MTERAENRAAHLLPEERAAGSEDPEAQADAILRDSEVRESGRDVADREHRTSEEAV